MHHQSLPPMPVVLRRVLGSRAALMTAVALIAGGLFFLATTNQARAQLKDAPDLVGGTDWLNTDKPIKLADLRGRIVVLDFWTLC
jgi:hypothetical protein